MQRLLSLIEKTGDRLIVTDPAGEHPYVLMGLDHYEKLVVGEWKPETVKHEPAPPQALPISTGFPDNKPPKREIPLWKAPATAPPGPRLDQNRPRSEENRPQNPPKQSQLAPPGPKPVSTPPPPNPTSVPASQLAAQESEGEEQFYLEPLE